MRILKILVEWLVHEIFRIKVTVDIEKAKE